MGFYPHFSFNVLTSFFLVSMSWSATAFTLNGPSDSKGWAGDSVVFRLNPENCPAGVHDLIRDALAVWNGVPTSRLKVSLGDDITDSLTQVSNGESGNVPAIFCYPNMSSVQGLDPNSIPGYATGQTFDGDGKINYGFIILNVEPNARANISTLDQTLVKVILAHEVGHVLGLGHAVNEASLMYYDGSSKKNLSLSKDDQDGVSYLYPREELTKDSMLGCAALGVESSQTNWSRSLLFLVVFFTPLFAGLLARRKVA